MAVDLQPLTKLGKRLQELRQRIVASRQPLLDWDELEREVAERRGGLSETEPTPRSCSSSSVFADSPTTS